MNLHRTKTILSQLWPTCVPQLLIDDLVINKVNVIEGVRGWGQVTVYWVVSRLGNHKPIFFQWLQWKRIPYSAIQSSRNQGSKNISCKANSISKKIYKT